ncbi:hypothetical protein Pmani_015820 [Petrolisthes manimaculis]|uniref:Uncharacterized protein n=1 Tax=Petrolisthes manimaculis TaxID=1843537 RepID=A0AAE1PT30_9EUCA|nr:hypothetical protein Pmani_015820 [Petrolisthes manimaculis]
MHVLVTRWIPPLERPRFFSYVYFASTFSVSITLPLCGVFIERYGWEATFYLTSLPSLVWCLAWFTLVCDFPDHHSRISEWESTYIVSKVKERGTYMAQRKGRDQKSVPWRSLITSVPLWATIIHSLGNNWCIAFFFTQLPTYMRNVLGFSIKSNGLLSALPFVSRYVGSITWSTLVDFSTSRNYISLLVSRKLACIVSSFIPAAMLLWLAYSGCHSVLALSLMCVALFCNGAVTISTLTNHTDIAPNFSGTTFGIDQTLTSILSFIVPVVVGVLIDGQVSTSNNIVSV